MNTLLLIIVIIGISVQQITKKAYNNKVHGGALCFSAACSLFSLPVFLITSGGHLEFCMDIVPYAVFFSVSYSIAVVFSVLAINEGPLSITSLVTSYSLVIPTFYGIIKLGESVSFMLVIGLVLLLVSLVFVNLENKGEKKQITLKWAIYAILAFLGNGVCTTVQKVQQLDFDGRYKNETMVLALVITVVTLFVIAFVSERNTVFSNLKAGFVTYSSCGIANGVVNYLVIILATRMAASVMFPLISAGGIVMAAAVAILFYKERLSHRQIIGLILGTVAIVALNI